MNGDTVTDAFYDTDLNITWLRDGSEMGHLWYVELGNSANFTNAGGFQNLQSDLYWSGLAYAPDPDLV